MARRDGAAITAVTAPMASTGSMAVATTIWVAKEAPADSASPGTPAGQAVTAAMPSAPKKTASSGTRAAAREARRVLREVQAGEPAIPAGSGAMGSPARTEHPVSQAPAARWRGRLTSPGQVRPGATAPPAWRGSAAEAAVEAAARRGRSSGTAEETVGEEAEGVQPAEVPAWAAAGVVDHSVSTSTSRR